MRIPLALLCSLGLCSSTLSAETHTYAKAGVQFDLPPGWKATPDGEELVVETTDESLLIILWMPADTTWDAAMDGFRDELDRMVNKVEATGKPVTGQLNGMPAVTLTGEGEVEDARVAFCATLMMAKRPLIALAFGPPHVWSENAARIERLVSSIKKTK